MKTPPPLLFDWPHRHRIHLLLPATLIAAAIAHSAIFFLFSIAYPPPEFDGPRPARVYFLPQGSPDLAQVESLLASNDPALFAPGRGLPRSEPTTIATYVPQYVSAKPALINPPSSLKPREAPPSFAGPVPLPQKSPPPTAPTSARSTRLTASANLAGRLPALPPDFHLTTSLSTPPDSASFLLGVLPDGTVAHLVPDQSSGDVPLDLAAMKILATLTFTRSGNPHTEWGFITFHWGSDIAPRQP